MRLLVVEDDPTISEPLVAGLSREGFDVDLATTGAEALAAEPADMVLLDLGLPDLDGRVVCQELRTRSSVPIIVVTARGDEIDRVMLLELGADDYVVKPFGARELLARVEAVMRRSPARPLDVATVNVAGREVDLERREVRLADGTHAALSEREADLLRYLANAPDRTVSRDDLLRSVWGIDPRGVRTRTVDVHVARLREKLRDDPADPEVVVTVRGKGYRLAGSQDSE